MKVFDRGLHTSSLLLRPTGDAHGPRRVSEVSTKLAQHGRRGECCERDAATRVEPVDRLDEPDLGDLHEVGDRHTSVGHRQGASPGEPAVPEDELVSQRGVARLVELFEQDFVVDDVLADRGHCGPPGRRSGGWIVRRPRTDPLLRRPTAATDRGSGSASGLLPGSPGPKHPSDTGPSRSPHHRATCARRSNDDDAQRVREC